MGKFKNILMIVAVAAVCLSACKKEEEDDDTKKSMSGSVKYDFPSYVLSGEYVTAVAGGIIDPVHPTFKWIAPGVIKDTIVGDRVTLHFPEDTLATFTVSALALCEGYYTTSSSVEVTTVDTSFNASLKGIVRSGKSVRDERDGHVYGYVTLGKLDWFSQNLAYAGGGVPFMSSPVTWSMFGYFYHWDDLTGGESRHGLGCGPRGMCPEGWTVPTNEDWEDLAAAMNGGESLPFADNWVGLGEKASADAVFQSDRMWAYSPDNGHTNDFGWNGIPMGYTANDHGEFLSSRNYGFWWSASEKNPGQAYYRYIYEDLSYFPMNYASKSDFGASVRCVRLATR